jgi:hypothetical protein
MNSDPKQSPHHSPERETRVAAALRENLRKRKQQQVKKDANPNSDPEDKKCP